VQRTRSDPPFLRWAAAGFGLAAAGYAAYVAAAWGRYGRPARPAPEEEDPLLDRFMPVYDVVERHQIRVDAPADVALAAARDMPLFDRPFVRGIIRGRELLLGASPDERPRPRGLLAAAQAMGWAVLAERPGREIIAGAVTKPWEPDVTFRGLPPDEFAAFAEPAYVKIAWTLRADPAGASRSVFRTETRAVATDAYARARFRRYWALLSPGIILIRWLSRGPLRAEVARRRS